MTQGLAPPRTAARRRPSLPGWAEVPRDVLAGMRAVFERDFLVVTSQPRFLWIRSLTILLSAAIVATLLLGASGTYQRSPDRMGQGVLVAALGTGAGLVLLIAPALAAASVAGERSLHTLSLVLAAPVRPLSFVLAKFASRLGIMLVLVFAILPIIALSLLLGGIGWPLFVDAATVLVGLCVMCAAAGTLVSAYSRSVVTAVLGAYGLAVLAPAVVTGVVAWILEEVRAGASATQWAFSFTPYGALGLTMDSSTGLGRGVFSGRVFLATALAAAVPALWLAARRLADEARHEAAADTRARRAHVLRISNPVVDRALRGSVLRRPGVSAWAELGCAVAFSAAAVLIAADSRELDEYGPHLLAMCLITGVAAFVALTRGAHAIASERQTGSLDLLRATCLRSAEIVRGQQAAIVARTLPLLAVALLHGLLAWPFSELRLGSVAVWFVLSLGAVWVSAAIGLRFSAASSTAGRGVLKSVAVVFGGNVVYGILLGLLVASTGGHAEKLYAFVSAGIPAVTLAVPSVSLSERYWPNELGWFVVGSIVFATAYGLLSWQCLRGTVARLERGED